MRSRKRSLEVQMRSICYFPNWHSGAEVSKQSCGSIVEQRRKYRSFLQIECPQRGRTHDKRNGKRLTWCEAACLSAMWVDGKIFMSNR